MKIIENNKKNIFKPTSTLIKILKHNFFLFICKSQYIRLLAKLYQIPKISPQIYSLS